MKRAGFTLTEIVIAIAIIATVMVAILGLLPAGLNASRDAADSTIIATILEDLNNRLKGQPLRDGPVAFSPAYYDGSGRYIPVDPVNPASLANAIYRADVDILDWEKQPKDTSSLRPAKISLSWPIRPSDGDPIGSDNPKVEVTFGVTTLTGPAWEEIDRNYVPKIDL
jgi:uncharacterized protein (TIGR02598 family)